MFQACGPGSLCCVLGLLFSPVFVELYAAAEEISFIGVSKNLYLIQHTFILYFSTRFTRNASVDNRISRIIFFMWLLTIMAVKKWPPFLSNQIKEFEEMTNKRRLAIFSVTKATLDLALSVRLSVC